jgi:multicomponent Na+:H+ antiporter subunit B
MTHWARRFVFLVAAAGFMCVILMGVSGLPPFGAFNGELGTRISHEAVTQRHAANVVASVVFDYRGFDTLGEEFILFAAVVGVALLLRAQREEADRPPTDEAPDRHTPPSSDAVRELALALIAPAVLFGLYVVAHGHLTPGGGFQGGVVLATAPLLLYLGGLYPGFRRLTPESAIEAAEGTGAGGYVIVGVVGMIAGSSFLQNVWPLGTATRLLSAGTIPILNLVVGVAVAAGFVFLLSEFLEQTLELRRRSKGL